jgi:AraC-like DNA-binding protein
LPTKALGKKGRHLMLRTYQTFQQLTGIRLFEYHGEESYGDLPYDERTNRRIVIDVAMMFQQVKTVDSFIIHAIYPHCYVIIWRPKMTADGSEIVFSEMLYTAAHSEVICCEKCHRIIDAKRFKQVSHEVIQTAGAQLLKMLEPTAIQHRYTTRSKSAATFCRDAVLCEIHEETCEQPLQDHVREIVRALSNRELDEAKKQYNHVLSHLKQAYEGMSSSDTIQGRFVYFMTAFTYELAEAFPNYKQRIFQMHHIAMTTFLKQTHYTNQTIFAQTYLSAYIKLLVPVSRNQTTLITHRVLQLIHHQYTGGLTLNAVAEQLCVQPSYLSRQFKKDVGMTFTQYLMGYRLKRAVILMRETTLPLTEIAMMVGFDSSAYFSTCFKSVYESSPSAYRRQCV